MRNYIGGVVVVVNGAGELKSGIWQNFDSRIRQLESNGCPRGMVQEEKIHTLTDNLAYLRKTVAAINDKLFWGLIIMCVISLLAGINVWNQIIALIK